MAENPSKGSRALKTPENSVGRKLKSAFAQSTGSDGAQFFIKDNFLVCEGAKGNESLVMKSSRQQS
jgi:hypothetical protein